MIKTTAIKYANKGNFSVIWDTGRRCNYDCSYCEATRHNNYSRHKDLEELKKTFDFIREYANVFNKKRKIAAETHINFTGGEPTINPNFWKLLEYIKSLSEYTQLGLTTNGAWNNKYSKLISKYISWVTVSYHAEAHQSLKDQCIKNILTLAENKTIINVNMMLHVDYWDECVSVYEMLKSKGINCRLRPIGDGAITINGWFKDTDGSMRRTSHEYTAEQQQWFWEQQGLPNKANGAAEGTQMGRACCGSICLTGKVDNVWQPIKLIDTHFKNWHCMVDWFFLYVDQETGEIYHHQTCKALLNNQRGSIGNLSDTATILSTLSDRLNAPTIEHIVCPNQRCGCGMCVPKAQSLDDFIEIKSMFINE